jgi:hypothetical protein
MFYILPLWAFKCIRFDGYADFLIPKFVVTNKRGWYTRLWRDWAGFSCPNCIITKEDVDDNPRYQRTLKHELQHCYQQWWFGPFHWVAYITHSVYLWLFTNKHAYLDNWFERDARRIAGQMVDIPRNMWRHGPDDRWPFW